MSIAGKNITIMKNVVHINVAKNTKYSIRVLSISSST